jgi:hypothetical protein
MGIPSPRGEAPFRGYSIERASETRRTVSFDILPMVASGCDTEDPAKRQNEGLWIWRKLEAFSTIGLLTDTGHTDGGLPSTLVVLFTRIPRFLSCDSAISTCMVRCFLLQRISVCYGPRRRQRGVCRFATGNGRTGRFVHGHRSGEHKGGASFPVVSRQTP